MFFDTMATWGALHSYNFHSMKNATRGRFRGVALLEMAVVLPVVVLLVAGAVDLSRILIAHSALQAGVDGALRCAFPREAACVAAPASEPAEPLFQWYLLSGARRYHYLTSTYTGEARWLSGTRFQRTARARVLGSVAFRRPHQRYQLRSERMLNTATIDAVTRAAVPFQISGADPRAPAISASAPDGTIVTRVSLAGLELELPANRSSITVRTPSFSLPTPVWTEQQRSAPCVVQEQGSEDWRSCSEQWSWDHAAIYGERTGRWQIPPLSSQEEGRLNTYAVLVVRGSTKQTAPNARGQLQLRLIGARVRDLGGQRFMGSLDNANFFARGAPAAWVDSAMREAAARDSGSASEFDKYQGIKLSYGAPYSLEFTLSRAAGAGDTSSLSWHGEELIIYTPRYSALKVPLPCSAAIASCASECALAGGAPFGIQTARRDRIMIAQDLGCAPDAQPPQLAAIERSVVGSLETTCTRLITRAGSCDAPREERACPENVGISPLQTTFRAAAAALCPAPRDAEPSSVEWHEQELTLPPLTWLQTECKQSPPSSPPHWGDFPNITISELALSEREPLAISADPARLLSSEPERFDCPAVQLHQESFGSCGDQPSLSGLGIPGAISAPALELVRQDAARCGIPAQAFIALTHSPLTLTAHTHPPSVGIPFSTSFDEPLQRTALLPPLRRGEVPEQCRSGTETCFATFSGSSSRQSRSEDPLQANNTGEFSAAERYGYQEISANYPAARPACVGADCSHVQVLRDGATIVASGSLEVPLTTLRVLGKTSVNLSAQATRRDERIDGEVIEQ